MSFQTSIRLSDRGERQLAVLKVFTGQNTSQSLQTALGIALKEICQDFLANQGDLLEDLRQRYPDLSTDTAFIRSMLQTLEDKTHG